MILFFSRHESSLKKMIDLMKYLKLCSIDKKVLLTEDIELSDLKKSEVVRIKKKVISDPFKKINDFRILIFKVLRLKGLSNFFFNSLLIDIIKIIFLVASYLRQTIFLKNFLKENNVKIIFLTGDRELGLTPPLIKAAKQLKIKVIIYSTGILSVHNLGLIRKDKSHSPALKLGNNILNMCCGLIFPKQTCKTDFGTFLFSKGWVTISLKILNMLSSNPWIQGAGNSDYIFVENKKSKSILKKNGVSNNKIKLIENIEYQNSVNSISKTRKKKIILFAIPIFFEHNLLNWERHELELRQYLRILSNHSRDVFFSFHPKSNVRNYDFIFKDFGFKKKVVGLTDLISSADLYICGSSSTINLAIIHKKPTINLSYVSNSDEKSYYKEIKFVKNTNSIGEFKKNLDISKTNWDKLIKESEKFLEDFFPSEKKIYRYIEQILDQS